MKIFIFLLALIKQFGFLYRIIGIGIAFMLFNDSMKDLNFVSSAKEAEPISIEELMELPKSEIPRYLKLKDLMLLSDSYVASQNEDSGRILDASFPVYSTAQLGEIDTVLNQPPPAYVIIKDTDFNEDSLSLFMNTVEGFYDDESFKETRDILVANQVDIAKNAILIVKKAPPSYKSSLIWTIVTGIIGLLIVLSFIPNSVLGLQNEEEAE